MSRYGAARTSLRTAGIMLLFALLFTALMSATYRVTRPAIEASEAAQRMRLINDILPPSSYDNALLDDYVLIGPTPALGIDRQARVFRAWRDGAPTALIVEAIAPDGYAGRIQLALAVSVDGRLSGVRVTAHAETPGLGDYIDPRKDKASRAAPWITQFNGLGVADIPPQQWRVLRDGGVFGYRAGATISARAVTEATGRALAWATLHHEALFAADTGSVFLGSGENDQPESQ